MSVIRMLCLLMLCAGLARARVIMVDTNTAGDIVDVYVSDVGDKLEQTDASVAVAVIIHNHSRYRSVYFGNHYPIHYHYHARLELEELDVSCGRFTGNSSLPEEILPGASVVLYMEKVGTGLSILTLFLWHISLTSSINKFSGLQIKFATLVTNQTRTSGFVV